MKFLGDNTENLLTDDLGFGDDFLDLTPKAQLTEEIIDNLDLVKIKNLLFKRLYQEKWRQVTDREKIFAKDISDKELLSKIYKELLKLKTEKTNKSTKK